MAPPPQPTPDPLHSLSLSSSEEAKDRLDFLWKIHGYTNDYIRFADTKAGFAAGAALAIMGALVASHLFDSLWVTPLTNLNCRVWFGALALLLLLLSAFFAMMAIRPRLKSDVPKGFIFWESVILHGSGIAYAAECKKLSLVDMELNVSRHIYALAAICTRKYFWTSIAIWTGLTGALLAGALILAIHILP